MFTHMKWKKAIPLIVVLGLASVITGTGVLGETVKTQVVDVFKEYVKGLVPMSANIFVGLIFLSLANLLYDPLLAGLERALLHSKADARGKLLVSRGAKLIYWIIALLLSVSLIAPDFLSKVVVGVGLFGAAIALALQGIANDFICGLLLNFRPKFCVGDEIELVGLNVKGNVLDVSYVLTTMDTKDGTYAVPNREVWSRAVKVTKPSAAVATTGDGISCANATTDPAAPAK